MSGLFPQGELFPVFLVAEVIAVIRPQNDDGTFRIRPIIQRLQQMPYQRIGEADGSEIALHGGAPFVVFDDPLLPRASSHRLTSIRNVIQILRLDSTTRPRPILWIIGYVGIPLL